MRTLLIVSLLLTSFSAHAADSLSRGSAAMRGHTANIRAQYQAHMPPAPAGRYYEALPEFTADAMVSENVSPNLYGIELLHQLAEIPYALCGGQLRGIWVNPPDGWIGPTAVVLCGNGKVMKPVRGGFAFAPASTWDDLVRGAYGRPKR